MCISVADHVRILCITLSVILFFILLLLFVSYLAVSPLPPWRSLFALNRNTVNEKKNKAIGITSVLNIVDCGMTKKRQSSAKAMHLNWLDSIERRSRKTEGKINVIKKNSRNGKKYERMKWYRKKKKWNVGLMELDVEWCCRFCCCCC